MSGPEKTDCECSSGCCGDARVGRRDFVKLAGAGVAAIASQGLPVMAGPFESNEYLDAIPADKKLDTAWIRSLFQRGNKETYRERGALKHIGMPVGGLFAGTVYLAGDGRLWLWDIFNRDQEGISPREAPLPEDIGVGNVAARNGLNYLNPALISQPFKIGFELGVGGKTFALNSTGFEHIKFDGRYPLGRVSYADPTLPLQVELEAFSPFIPLNVDDSSLPATVMSFRVSNVSEEPVDAILSGELQNPVCLESKSQLQGLLHNRIVRDDSITALQCTAAPAPRRTEASKRPDIVFEQFEGDSYGGWTAEGDAFGSGPVRRSEIPSYQGDVGGKGDRVVNSHASAPGEDIPDKDARVGTLTSPTFTIERRFIQFFVGGGPHVGQTCVNVIVDGKTIASKTGRSANTMHRTAVDVSEYAGQEAKLQIVDRFSGGWGNIGVDEIVFTDHPLPESEIEQQRDYGCMALALLDATTDQTAATANKESDKPVDRATAKIKEQLVGSVSRSLNLNPGESQTVVFVISWHFPNFRGRGLGNALVGHSYAARFNSALEVTRYLALNYDRLAGDTRKWVDTWYDSSLPYWLLDRAMANTSTLATTTCYRFKDGRFWAWEGIGCCPGTCTHVWHYAQAVGRLFPEIERTERERVNFGLGQHDDGSIGMRAGLAGSNTHADDGQCGRILGVLREHQMSPDDDFLRRLWPNVKRAMQFMIRRDGNADGMLEGAQPNTLDADWFGKISFISSLYLAMLHAGEALALEMGDELFAQQCREIADRGAESILETFNGEYFIQIEDPNHLDQIGVGPGCYIDQVFGQTWAHWVGLGRLFDRDKQLAALRSLWKYSFVPDVGAFRDKFRPGRWYASAGDAGLIMCSWPKGGKNPAFKNHWQYGYFNECMTGFEYQAAAHMIWEGRDNPDLLRHGLAITRAIHDRYNAALRNPYNEIECSDHYSRAMASYGVFQAVCGFNCHGPQGRLAYAPRISAENFKAAFTGPEGWGSISQKVTNESQLQRVTVRWGKIRLRSLSVVHSRDVQASRAVASIGGREVAVTLQRDGDDVTVTFSEELEIQAEEALEVVIS